MKPTNAVAEASRTFELMRVKQLQLIPDHISAGMTSPSLSPSPSSTSLNLADSTAAMSMSLSATGPASPSSGSSERGAVALCTESAGIRGLFQRAQSIGRPGLESSNSPRKNVIGAASSSTAVPAASSEGGGNPLARRGSAVMKHQQQQQPQPSAPSVDGGSSLMAEVPDELLSAYNIRPSEDTPLPLPAPVPSRAAPARADPFSAHRLSPMKPSEKSQSLMADLMGGGDAGAGGAPSAPAKQSSSVWEDV